MKRIVLGLLLGVWACSGPKPPPPEEAVGDVPRKILTKAALGEPYVEMRPDENLDPIAVKRAPVPVVWPYEDVEITSPYGFRRHPVVGTVLYHRGVDIMKPQGHPVRAVAPGVVWRAGYNPVMGNHVILRHIGGMMSIYAHLSDIVVAPGDSVSEGTLLGLTGTTGRSTGPHLHLGIVAGGHTVDPLLFLGRCWTPSALKKDAIPWVYGWEGEVRFF